MFGLVKESRLNKLQQEYDELKTRLDRCREIEAKNKLLENEIRSLEFKLAETEKQIREQTEADLFFVSAKIQKELLDGKKTKDIQELRTQQLLYQNLLASQQQSAHPSVLDQYLGALGARNIFGGY